MDWLVINNNSKAMCDILGIEDCLNKSDHNMPSSRLLTSKMAYAIFSEGAQDEKLTTDDKHKAAK
eukprot:6926498-Prymnesium_polylepis.1